MIVVIINGYPQSGKDTFVLLCEECTPIENLLTSTPMKEAFMILGWDGVTKSPEVRDGLSQLKDLSIKLFDTPYKYIRQKLNRLDKRNREDTLVFVHSREPQEIERFKKEFNAITLFISREEAKKDSVALTNHSDLNVENYFYDVMVGNDSTLQDLRSEAYRFVEHCFKEGVHYVRQ